MTTATPDLDQLHTDALAAVEAFILDRLDFEPSCEAVETFTWHGKPTPEPTCGATADWTIACIACRVTRFVCHPHLERFQKQCDKRHRTLRCRCGHCGTFQELLVITPLRGRG